MGRQYQKNIEAKRVLQNGGDIKGVDDLSSRECQGNTEVYSAQKQWQVRASCVSYAGKG